MWKNHPNIKYLQISSKGRVRTEDRYVGCGNGQRLQRGQILKDCSDRDGYRIFSFNSGDGRKTLKVHRVVAQTFLDNPLNLPEVNHIDGDKSNNSLDNLEWCDKKENQQHAIKIGLRKGKEVAFCSNCGKETYAKTKTFLCFDCYNKTGANRKVSRPSKEELFLVLKEKSFVEVGRIYGVSDNAIKKWCKDYNLPDKRKDYKEL